MEGLDVSGCFAMDLGGLVKLRGNTVLKCLLLEYLLIKSDHLKPLTETKITTLSVFCKFYAFVLTLAIDSKNLNFTHLEAIKGIRSLTALNILDCPQITEECK